MKLWIDDVRQPPSDEWLWVMSVDQAVTAIRMYERQLFDDTIIIDLDHDAGGCACDGGDYIKILDWLEENNIVDTGYTFHVHSMNPVGRHNMEVIIMHNGWRLI